MAETQMGIVPGAADASPPVAAPHGGLTTVQSDIQRGQDECQSTPLSQKIRRIVDKYSRNGSSACSSAEPRTPLWRPSCCSRPRGAPRPCGAPLGCPFDLLTPPESDVGPWCARECVPRAAGAEGGEDGWGAPLQRPCLSRPLSSSSPQPCTSLGATARRPSPEDDVPCECGERCAGLSGLDLGQGRGQRRGQVYCAACGRRRELCTCAVVNTDLLKKVGGG